MGDTLADVLRDLEACEDTLVLDDARVTINYVRLPCGCACAVIVSRIRDIWTHR